MGIVVSLDKKGSDNDYIRSLRDAGVSADEIVDLPSSPAEIEQAIAEADGLLLGGGEDIDPARYGESVRFANVEVNSERDAREFAAYAAARRAGLPLFAICRGLQLVNVARGGTLIQDIPSEKREGNAGHRLLPKDAEAHEILIDPARPGEILRACFPAGTAPVNSRHHQAIAHLAPDLSISALAPDGIAEAVAEKEASHEFFLAVQWHPENFPMGSGHGELFRLFVSACRRRQSSCRRGVAEEAIGVAR